MVFRQGDPGNVMYFVVTGKLEARQYLSLEEARAGGPATEQQAHCQDAVESSQSSATSTK